MARRKISPEEWEWRYRAGKRMRREREAAGYTRTEFAQEIGVSYTRVKQYENGESILSVYEFMRACQILGKDMNSMAERKGKVILSKE